MPMSDFALASIKSRGANAQDTAPISAAETPRDQMQIALAIADGDRLRSLLTDSKPSVVQSHQIGTVSANIGVPIEGSGVTLDGVVRYELIHCVLAHHCPPFYEQPPVSSVGTSGFDHRAYAQITQFQSDLKDLAQNVPLSQAIALLTHAGFDSQQISTILHLPQQGWYKSWWYGLDSQGHFTQPFQRWFRSKHFTDGTFSLQYRDFYPQEAPLCFKSETRMLPVVIQATSLSFRDTLELVNQARNAFQSDGAILICDRLSELELQGYVCQGVSVYGADELLAPSVVNCSHCIQHTCPLQGDADSPVERCKQFVA